MTRSEYIRDMGKERFYIRVKRTIFPSGNEYILYEVWDRQKTRPTGPLNVSASEEIAWCNVDIRKRAAAKVKRRNQSA